MRRWGGGARGGPRVALLVTESKKRVGLSCSRVVCGCLRLKVNLYVEVTTLWRYINMFIIIIIIIITVLLSSRGQGEWECPLSYS